MNIATRAVALVSLLFAGVGHAQSQPATEPKFRIIVVPETRGGPNFTVTNLSGKTLTACHIRFSASSESAPQLGMSWDPILAAADPRGPRPLTPGASVTMYLPHAVGGPLPDKAQIVAGVWADGETFGETEWVKQLLDNRTLMASNYEQAIGFLQRGADQNWTRAQYLAALNGKGNSGPFYAIRSTLQANGILNTDSRNLVNTVQDLLALFTKRLGQLREARPTESASTHPQ
jgi:hypothetical protein